MSCGAEERPSLAPGMYFRVMLIGFFEGIESERGIAWGGGRIRYACRSVCRLNWMSGLAIM